MERVDQVQWDAFRFETGFSQNQFFRIVIVRSVEWRHVERKIAGARFPNYQLDSIATWRIHYVNILDGIWLEDNGSLRSFKIFISFINYLVDYRLYMFEESSASFVYFTFLRRFTKYRKNFDLFFILMCTIWILIFVQLSLIIISIFFS